MKPILITLLLLCLIPVVFAECGDNICDRHFGETIDNCADCIETFPTGESDEELQKMFIGAVIASTIFLTGFLLYTRRIK